MEKVLTLMDRVSDTINRWLLPVASKIGSQRHLVAIRDSFIDITPIIMVYSLFILLNSLVFTNVELVKMFPAISKLTDIGLMVNAGTMGVMTIFVTFLIGYRLSNYYVKTGFVTSKQLNPLHAGILSLAVALVMFPLNSRVTPVGATESVEVSGVYTQTLTSSGGMFVGIIAALVATEVLVRITRGEKLRISMPEGVPPAVAQSFNSLLPQCLIVICVAVLTFAYVQLSGGSSVPDLIQTIISIPLQAAMESPLGLFVVQLMTQVLWFFGLHGQNIVSAVTSPSMLAAIQQNIEAFSNGAEVPNIVTNPWIGMYTLFGGTGAILPLLIAVFIGSKRKRYREVAKLGLVPSFFNVSEPIMFGMPVVLNPYLLVPFIVVPLINLAIAYPLTAIGVVAKSVVIPPWTLPPIITAWVTTAGDIPATILSAALFVLDIFLYLSFIIASNKGKDAGTEAE